MNLLLYMFVGAIFSFYGLWLAILLGVKMAAIVLLGTAGLLAIIVCVANWFFDEYE